jgi:adenylate kinase
MEEQVKRRQRKFLHNAFTESDFAMRQSSKEYFSVREAEDLVLNFKRDNVKTYVIAAGILYGKGEAILNDHFKKAWL